MLGLALECACCGTRESERWVFKNGEWRCEACSKKCDPRTSYCSLKKQD